MRRSFSISNTILHITFLRRVCKYINNFDVLQLLKVYHDSLTSTLASLDPDTQLPTLEDIRQDQFYPVPTLASRKLIICIYLVYLQYLI
jgi:hypothetical protein